MQVGDWLPSFVMKTEALLAVCSDSTAILQLHFQNAIFC